MTLDAHVQVRVGTRAVDVELTVAAGEVLALLGPNGAGKTTVLRTLAGLIALDAGHVTLDGTVLDAPPDGRSVPPRDRSVGVVFQELVLFPHLDALDNVAFGSRSRGISRREARARAGVWLERLGLADRASHKPAALSGGEAQRVALARALATEPRLLLLDEPLAALDVSVRDSVRADLHHHLSEFGGACVLVTHDPVDAAVLADRVSIIEAGRLVQTGTLPDITARPQSTYAADLAGVNLLRGDAHDGRVTLDTGGVLTVPDGGEGSVLLLMHPHAVALHRRRPEGSPRNVWEAVVESVTPVGSRVRVRLAGPVALVAEVTVESVADLHLERGTALWASVKATEIEAFPG